MTIEQLVKNFIDIAMSDEFVYNTEFIRKVYSSDGFEVFSLALNDETRDVRYVKVDWRDSDVLAFEVRPVTVLKTEYRRV